jgi:HSP20 family protein
MALVSLRNDPVGVLSLQDALAQMLGRPVPPWDLGTSSPSVFPPVNVFSDKDGGLVIRAEAPGVDPATLDINVEPERVTIAGERKGHDDGGNGFHRRERRFGRFSRSVRLPPDLDPDKTAATYRDGMLTIRIEKAEAAKPRRITVAH